MKNILGIALAIVILVVLQVKFDIFNLDDTPSIEETANVVEEIRKISEFTTACYYEEAVVKNTKKPSGFFSNLFSGMVSDDELVIIVRGTVRAGYDMSKIADQLRFNGDTAFIPLPAAEIIDVIINPSDRDIFIETGKWSHEETTALLLSADEKIKQDAIENGILRFAKENGEYRLRQLFTAFGFKHVEFKR